MNEIICEICDGHNIIKENGVYVCKDCGTKYSIDEIKKLRATLTTDKKESIDNLYIVARRARDNNNSELAKIYYQDVLRLDPNSWEATFYATYFSAYNCRIEEIPNNAALLINMLESVFSLIDRFVDENNKKECIIEVENKMEAICASYNSSLINTIPSVSFRVNDFASSCNILRKHGELIRQAIYPLDYCGDTIFKVFNNSECRFLAKEMWISFINIKNDDFTQISKIFGNEAAFNKDDFLPTIEKIKNIDPSYQPNFTTTNSTKSGGCYVATCVYGSYDCPEVWTLRRFRDFTLSTTVFGKLFIKIYYFLSPKIIKIVGKTKWFQTINKKILDCFIIKLNNKGYSNTPYKD